MPKTSPTAWAYLHSGDYTIRWQRGDNAAYIFSGKQMDTSPDNTLKVKIFDTIPVSPSGWTDQAEVRRAGEKWVTAHRERCKTCGVYS